MLTPSDRFTAKEITYLQEEAEDWINEFNRMILEAAEDGNKSAMLNVHDPKEKDHFNKYYNAPNALRKHFEDRGFKFEWSQSQITISW